MKECSTCKKKTKDTLFGSDRSLKLSNGINLYFCSSICREIFKKEKNLEVYDRKP